MNARNSSPAHSEVVSTSKITVAIIATLLIISGVMGDVQGVALSPLVGTIRQDVGLSGSQIGWIINGVTLVGAMGAGLISRLGDLVGHKKVLIPIIALALVGSLLCALATDFLLLVCGRLLVGLSVPSVALIWGLIRPRATARQTEFISMSLGTVLGLGVAASLVLGGILLYAGGSWQSVFWLSAAGFAAMLILAWLSPESPASVRQKVPLDWIGGIGLGAWLVALLLGISWLPSYGWSSSQVLLSFSVFMLIFAAWVVQQMKAPHRLMAFSRSDLRQMISGYTGQWHTAITAIVFYTLVPSMLQAPVTTGYGFGLNVLESTLPLLVWVPGALTVQFTAGMLLDRFGPRLVMIFGGMLEVAGLLGIAFYHDSLTMFCLWIFPFCVGMLTCYNVGWALTTAAGRQDNISITVGLQYAGTNLVAAITGAVVLSLLNPDAKGFLNESIFVNLFTGTAIVMGGIMIVWMYLVPHRLVDKHAAMMVPESDAVVVTVG